MFKRGTSLLYEEHYVLTKINLVLKNDVARRAIFDLANLLPLVPPY